MILQYSTVFQGITSTLLKNVVGHHLLSFPSPKVRGSTYVLEGPYGVDDWCDLLVIVPLEELSDDGSNVVMATLFNQELAQIESRQSLVLLIQLDR